MEIGKYQILTELGRGAMGVVYKAMDPSLERLVAIKVISVGIASDARVLRRFEREAKAIARMSHQNIVTVFAEFLFRYLRPSFFHDQEERL